MSDMGKTWEYCREASRTLRKLDPENPLLVHMSSLLQNNAPDIDERWADFLTQYMPEDEEDVDLALVEYLAAMEDAIEELRKVSEQQADTTANAEALA